MTLNPAGTPEAPVFRDGRLNPFAVPRIREAMNWLIDRDYMVAKIYGGMAIPRFFLLHPAFPDYARYIDITRRLELYYAHNPAKATRIITEEMEKLGARRIGGIWHWEIAGVLRPVVIRILGRSEDARRYVAHYVGRLMEDLGFKTRVDNKTAAAATPIWLHGDPYKGLMHIFTGGWSTSPDADSAGRFNFFYTPRGFAFPLWAATKPSPEFDELADRLARRDYETLAERATMFERALVLALQDSHRVWTVKLTR